MNRKQRRGQAKASAVLDYEGLHRRLLAHHAALQIRAARRVYERILADENPHALELFGDTALRYQQFEQAVSLLTRAVGMGRASCVVYNNLGLAQLHLARLADAEASFAAALALDADDFHTWVNLGILERDRGNFDAARRALECATRANPNHANAHLHLAETHLRNKAPELAHDSIETALLLAPGSTWGLALRSVALCELGERERFRELVAYDALVRLVDATAAAGFEDLERFHQSLARHIARHPTLQREPPGFSTRAGCQTLGNLLADAAPVIRSLETMVDDAVASVLGPLQVLPNHPQMFRRPSRFRLEGWGVRLSQGGHQTSHIHRDGWWSAVYYIDLGGVVDAAEPHAGWLELGRGPDALYPCGSTPDSLLVRPQLGRFVIFPSYLWHRTIPFERNGTRVSFAFDVIPA